MTRRFGNRATFPVEIGEKSVDSADLRIVDLWGEQAAPDGRRQRSPSSGVQSHPLPQDLNKVFIARMAADQFATTLQAAAEHMRGGYRPRDYS